NVTFTNELSRRYGDKGIVSCCVNPGNCVTQLSRHVNSGMEHFLLWGALPQLWAGTSPEGVHFNARVRRLGRAKSDTNDQKLGRELWTWLEEKLEQL
ncbi:hypothetical protein K438DRAFT_1572850, partial [Mycena galopus ATCC 62051]